MGRTATRRGVLAAGATVASGALVVGGFVARADGGWTAVDSPTGNTLYDAATLHAGPYAVGGGGVLLSRADGSWTVAVDRGVTGQNKPLYAAAATADRSRLWAAGSSGRVGRYDPDDGAFTDHSHPAGLSTTFRTVAVVGRADDERVYLGIGSGRVVVGTRASDGSLTWTVTDTGGSYTVTAVDCYDRTHAHAVTAGGRVFATGDGGDSWQRVDEGSIDVALHAIVSDPTDVFAAGDRGRVFRLDCECDRWTPLRAGSKDLAALERRDGRYLGAGGSGRLLERTRSGWAEYVSPTGNALHGVALGDVDVVVGGSGTLLERQN